MKKVNLKDFDYTEWLGPGYKEKQELPKKVSTCLIAPHVCWMDTIIPGGIHQPAFCVKEEGKNVPILCGILLGMQAFFIDRTSGEVAVQQIIDKQRAIEKDPRNPPIMIMPEGT